MAGVEVEGVGGSLARGVGVERGWVEEEVAEVERMSVGGIG